MQPPEGLWGKAGEFVPTVDPADLKKTWQFCRDAQTRNPQLIAIGRDVFKAVCSPGADVRNVTYRNSMLGMLFWVAERHPEEPVLSPLRTALAQWKQGIADDRLFRVMAKIPLKWLPSISEGGQQGWPFDVEKFIKQVEQEAA